MTSTSRRPAVIWAGAIVLVIGLLAAVALWVAGGSRRSEAIENLARAPIGCDTTLDFAETGEYLIFVETSGRLNEVRGDCAAVSPYDVDVVRPPVEVTLIDPDGEPLELVGRVDDVTYSSDGFVGRSVLSVQVEEAADHVMRVESESQESFAVAVGRDPNSGVALLRGAGVAAALVGLLAGITLLAAGLRRRADTSSGAWTPGQPGQSGQAGWVAGAPTQPPYRQPPTAYGHAPGQGQPQYGAAPQPGQPQYGPAPQPGQVPPQPGQPQYGSAPQPGQPQYGSAPQPGQVPPQYGQATTPPPNQAQPPGQPAAGSTQWAPAANPFAPPSGQRRDDPTSGVADIPGQPRGPQDAAGGSGDGARGWPGESAGSAGDQRPDDAVPSFDDVVGDADPAVDDVDADDPVDRWNTAPRRDGPTPPP